MIASLPQLPQTMRGQAIERLIRVAQVLQRMRFGCAIEDLRKEASEATGREWHPRSIYRDVQLLERLGLVEIRQGWFDTETAHARWIGTGGFFEQPATVESLSRDSVSAYAKRIVAEAAEARAKLSSLRAELELAKLEIAALKQGQGVKDPANLPEVKGDSRYLAGKAVGIADCLREVIQTSGRSANSIAKACGVPQNCLSRFLRGGADLSVQSLERIASHFELRLSLPHHISQSSEQP